MDFIFKQRMCIKKAVCSHTPLLTNLEFMNRIFSRFFYCICKDKVFFRYKEIFRDKKTSFIQLEQNYIQTEQVFNLFSAKFASLYPLQRLYSTNLPQRIVKFQDRLQGKAFLSQSADKASLPRPCNNCGLMPQQ